MSLSFTGSAVGNILGTLYFLLYQAVGLFLACRLFREKEKPIFRLLMGSVFGSFLLHWCPVIMAFFVRFHLSAQLLALIIPAVLVFLAWRFLPCEKGLLKGGAWREHSVILVLGAVTFLFFTVTLINHTIMPNANGGMDAGQCTYGDMNVHLAYMTGMVTSPVFPVDYTIFPGARLCYPFLSDSISSSIYAFGASLRYAYILPMLFAFLQLSVGFYLFADSFLGEKRRSVVAWIFFFFCGGFGFFYFLGARNMSGAAYTFSEIFTEFYHTPTNLIDENIRWVNIICDMLIPQRASLFGWAMLFPALLLLYRSVFSGKTHDMPIAGILIGGLPMIHTHSFMAAGMVSAVWLLYSLIAPYGKDEVREEVKSAPKSRTKKAKKPLPKPYIFGLLAPIGVVVLTVYWHINHKTPFSESTLVILFILPLLPVLAYGVYALFRSIKTCDGKKNLLRWGIFLGIILVLALPQLFTWTLRQATENSMVHPHFNWVNSDGAPDNSYFWFYLKNMGIVYILGIIGFILAPRSAFYKAAPALLLFHVTEFFMFQPNIYDNNKLLYVAYAFLCFLAADVIFTWGERYIQSRAAKGLTLTALLFLSSFSAILSMGREYVSNYELYDAGQIAACRFLEENASPSAMILTNCRHNNAVASLTGRSIVCGANSVLYTYGFDTSERQADIARMFQTPAESRALFDKYNIEYIMVSDYERYDYHPDEAALTTLFPLVYNQNGVALYRVK